MAVTTEISPSFHRTHNRIGFPYQVSNFPNGPYLEEKRKDMHAPYQNEYRIFIKLIRQIDFSPLLAANFLVNHQQVHPIEFQGEKNYPRGRIKMPTRTNTKLT
jgi:hypothetical protein